MYTHDSNRSLNSSVLLNNHAALRICHAETPTQFSVIPSLSMIPEGTVPSFLYASHQFELINNGARHSRYAFLSQKLSLSQLCGDCLSSSGYFHHPSDQVSGKSYFDCLCMKRTYETLMHRLPKPHLKLLSPSGPFGHALLKARTPTRFVLKQERLDRLQVPFQRIPETRYRQAR